MSNGVCGERLKGDVNVLCGICFCPLLSLVTVSVNKTYAFCIAMLKIESISYRRSSFNGALPLERHLRGLFQSSVKVLKA